jgi:hypothetical protein
MSPCDPLDLASQVGRCSTIAEMAGVFSEALTLTSLTRKGFFSQMVC